MHDTTLPEKGAEKKRWAISMRSGASGMLLAAWRMEGGDDLLTSALRTRPRLRPEPDRDQFFAIITQEEGKGFGARNRSVVLINDRLRTEPRRGNVPTQRDFGGKLVWWHRKERKKKKEWHDDLHLPSSS